MTLEKAKTPIRAWLSAMSTAVWWLTCALALPAAAHELQPAIADVQLTATTVRAEVEVSLEPIVLGMDLEGLENTDDANESEQVDALRALEPEALRTRFEAAWPDIQPLIRLMAGDTRLALTVDAVDIPAVGNTELARPSVLHLSAALPDDASDIRFGWDAALGGLIVRQLNANGEVDYAALLPAGADSAPMPRGAAVQQTLTETLLHYVVVGFEHIIPKGLDHILFVLGLFFFSLAFKPLLIQVTVFTLAHTVTLALASLGHVSIPASIVEPLIALSIAYVALENLRGGEIGWHRIAVVFAFGLLHGLGFAYVLGDVGLPPSQFIASLVAFNVGVEIGQLAVIALAFVLVGLPFGKRPWYRNAIAIPASLAIAAVGLYWTVERVFF